MGAIVAAFTAVPTTVPTAVPAASTTPQPTPTPMDVRAIVEAAVSAITPIPMPTPAFTATPAASVTPQPTATPMVLPDVVSTSEAVVLAQPTVTPIPIPSNQQDLAGIIESVKDAVVLIRTDDSDGTGFVVSDDGYVMTNAHVISGAGHITVRVDGLLHTPRVVSQNAERDIALLKIDPRVDLHPLRFAIKTWLGEDVLVIGYPLELNSTITASKGIVSGFPTVRGAVVLQTDAATNSGSSGGPVVNMNGEVVGMVRSSAITTFNDEQVLAEGVNYAVNLPDIKAYWRNRGAGLPTATPISTANALLVHGPESGEIEHDLTSTKIDIHRTLAWVANGEIEATIFNPYPPTLGDWSVGLALRSSERYHYLIVDSDGDFTHDLYSADDGYETVVSKEVLYINRSGGASNDLRVVMRGDEGQLWINDSPAISLDLSGHIDAGEVWVVGSYFSGHGLDGSSTEFEDLNIWTFD